MKLLLNSVNLLRSRIDFKQIFSKMGSNAKFQYPIPQRDDSVIDDYFGAKVEDPYRWMESPDSEKTKQFVDAQNLVTLPYLSECQDKDNIRKRITDLWNYPKMSSPSRHGSSFYQYRNTGLQNQSVIYQMKTLGTEGKIFLDPNTLSPDGTVALQGTAFTDDGSVFAYGLSSSGSDWMEIKFRNIETGEDYDEVLKKVRYSSLTWMNDNKGFFYGAYLHQSGHDDGTDVQTSEHQKLYYHVLGTDQSEDVAVVEFEDPHLRMGAKVSHCGQYLVITPVKGCKNNLLYIGSLATFSELKQKVIELQPIVVKFVADYEYVTNNGTKFFFRTNKNAPNYCVIMIDLNDSSEDKWVTVIYEHEKDVLDWVKPINDNKLIISYLQDCKHVMYLYELTTGNKVHDFHLDMGTISSISGKRKHTQMFYSFCSFLTPNVIYQVDFDGDQINHKVYHETVVGDFNKDLYETKQEFYTSKDGTQIPMFLISRKGIMNNRSGNHPCLLYGYGGFNVNLTPSFGISRLIFINNFKGIYALANIRGGGEYGNKWHDGGRFENKQNCFDDFQYAAKYLIEKKYTTNNKLVIQGGSNGGLLVAACMNQQPGLFGAVICQVGVLDMLRYDKFTIGYAWKSDYGCSDEKEGFDYLIKYSPLHNIFVPTQNKQYPAVLLLTADHDDRVVPLHSLKFIAELQHKAGFSEHQTNPLMIRIETRAGHGAGKPTSKLIDELTDVFCFISRSLNLPFSE